MRDKLLTRVVLPATQEAYDIRMPYDLTVEESARLSARLLAAREPARYEADDEVDLMLIAGEGAGELLNPKETIRGLLLAGRLAEGSALMLM